MMTLKGICIKAVRLRGGLIEWNYDNGHQAARPWRTIVHQGITPDTSEPLASACYFKDGAVTPTKYWERRELTPFS